MKFYVNEFFGDRLGGEQAGFPNIYPNMYIGLFTQCETKGEGNFCGYYGAEYYLDTDLLAYYEAEGGVYRPEKRISDAKECYIHRRKFPIGSHMWTKVIEAETAEEAIEKFKNAEWREWRFEDTETTVEEILEEYDDGCHRIQLVSITDSNTTYFYEGEDIDFIDYTLLSRIVKDLIISVDNGAVALKFKV